MTLRDVGRQSEARTLGGGNSTHIPNLALFDRFGYSAATLSNGVKTEKPFYCYDAEVLIIKGPCMAGPIAAALEPEGLVPVLTADGQALASVWVNKLRDTVIGPYNEIVVAIDAWAPGTRAAPPPAGPFGQLHGFFGRPCVSFLHTLYITSPLSIMWGREMQAFPKHPRPAAIEIASAAGRLDFDVRWDDRRLMAGSVSTAWDPVVFAQESLGLLAAFGPLDVLAFLAAPVVRLPVRMPAATKALYGVKNDHTGHILKGLDPTGVRAWPWRAGDRLELGTGFAADAEAGREAAPDLLVEAGFRPHVVVHVPSLQMVVTDDAAPG